MSPPELDDRTVGQLLRSYLPLEPYRRLVLVHGRYASSAEPGFTVEIGGTVRAVTVQDQQSVLGVLGAWQDHRESVGDDSVLVVTTGVADHKLSWDLRGHALRHRTLTVDRAEIVAQRFGAAEVEPRMRQEPWLFDALLDAEPPEGWTRSGPVLTYAAAVRALLAVRFGLSETVPDAGALLEWSQTNGPSRYTALPKAEQAGLAAWLTTTVGPFASLFTTLLRAGRADDVLPLGILMSIIDESGVPTGDAVAIGSLLPGIRTDESTRAAFVTAVQGTIERWIVHVENGGVDADRARRNALQVLDRADAIADDLGVAATDHRFLPSGFRGRMDVLASVLRPDPDETTVSSALAALDRLREHWIAHLYPDRVAAAAMAVRLMRWLATTDATADTVPAVVRTHLRTGGWVDRALTTLWAGDPATSPRAGHSFGRIHDAARARRDVLDERFAGRLRVWTEHAAATAPGGALLIENVLEAVASPLLTANTAPLIVVVDGMSAAVAVELGEQILDRGWTEISRDESGREAAVALVPSVTRVCRTSLLTGRATAGDRTTERDGFAALWKRHGREAELLHKSDIAGTAGRRLSERLVTALADGTVVVGVVLNTVDDALDHGREGERTGWRLRDITYLPDLLDAARSYGRPVVLVSDHGHVLERSADSEKAGTAGQAPSARWRTGTAGEGEIELCGPRVLDGGGRVVVPWKEGIRYTQRRAGYHGGASLAEMTVPVLAFVATGEDVPMGFSVLTPELTCPVWWNGRGGPAVAAAPRTVQTPPSRRRAKPDDSQAMLDDMPAATPPTARTLGSRVVGSAPFKAQRATLRRAPEPDRVRALIDSMNDAGGELTATAAVAELGRAGRDPGPVLAHLQRLLNLEGYAVISFDGRTVRLDVDMLHTQFGLDAS